MKQNEIHMKSRQKKWYKPIVKKYSKPKTMSFTQNPKTTNPIHHDDPFIFVASGCCWQVTGPNETRTHLSDWENGIGESFNFL